MLLMKCQQNNLQLMRKYYYCETEIGASLDTGGAFYCLLVYFDPLCCHS